MTEKNVLKPQLWTPRPVAETIAVYADWAATYDAEVTARGYHTPARISEALKTFVPPETEILDFGCGTGLSGIALQRAGFTTIDGTDITAQMLDRAHNLNLYRKLWQGDPDDLGFECGAYPVIAAVGVISLGAAPADLLATLMDRLKPGGLLVFSYNDPTLADQSYSDAIKAQTESRHANLVFREHGPHLDDVGMGSDVIILRRL